MTRNKFIIFFIIIVFIGVLHLNSLSNQFTNWDDQMIYSNHQIRSLGWENIKTIFTPVKAGTYQPIRVLSYALDYYFWKLNPLGYHITSLFLYVLTCLMVFFTIYHLSSVLRSDVSSNSHKRVAIFSTFLFAAHPVHVEAVTWLAARKEVLQGFFFFLAFYLYLKGRGETGKTRFIYLGAVLFSFLLATLSKPSAIVFPVVLLVYEISLGKNRWIDLLKRHWLFFVFSILISAIFTLILLKVMWDAGGIKPYWGGTLFSNLLTSFYVFIYNIKLLAFMINYSAAYTIPISAPILSFKTFVFVAITLLFFGWSIWSLKKTRVFFFSFFFFFVTLLPYLNIIPISTILADRYVFIPSFSYVFLIGIAFDKLYEFRIKRFSDGFFKLLSVAIFIFILAGYSFMTIRQNQIWKNSYTLWSDAVEKAPESNTANALMGVVYMDLKMDEKAAKYLEKAVQILPYDYQSRNNLGIVYGNLGQIDKGLKELAIAMYLEPDDDNIKINLSVLYQKEKEYQKSEAVLRFLLSKKPKDANLHFRLGLLYKEMGRYKDAISELTMAMELAPHIINPYEELGNIYLNNLNDVERAKWYYKKGIESVPEAKTKVEALRRRIQDLEGHR